MTEHQLDIENKKLIIENARFELELLKLALEYTKFNGNTFPEVHERFRSIVFK